MVKLGLVVSEWNFDITGPMHEFAKRHADFLGAQITIEVMVPGVYDMPLAVSKILEHADVDAVVTLGAVVEGETEHDQVVVQHSVRKLVDLSVQYGKPVSLGISGPGMTRVQALERVNDYGRRSVEAAVKLAKRLEKM